jgi:Uma2 family endonuclease
MKATLRLARAASYAEYLAIEHMSPVRHELLDGVIVAMSGGSGEHNAIAGRFALVLGQRLRKGCVYYSPDQRFWIAAQARARYSDGSVICGKPEPVTHDPQAFTNPVIVVEVLSPSSAGDDDGEKRTDYQSLSSLVGYVVAAQDQRCVRVYRRHADGGWAHTADVYRDGDSFELPTLTTSISVAEIYEGLLDSEGRSLLR